MKTIQEVWTRTKQSGDCQIWQGGTHQQGYPMIRWRGSMKLVARIVMEDKLGRPLERWERVGTTCGNKRCLNPDHMHIRNPGEEGYHTKRSWALSDEAERDVWDTFNDPTVYKWGLVKKFCEKYSVSSSVINTVRRRGPRKP